jgi:anti-sigma factor ChrR (cupin superfamily)
MSAKKSKSKRGAPGSNQRLELHVNETSARLALALPQVAPPAAVKKRLLARIRAAKQGGLEAAGWRFAALTVSADWVPLPFPGVKMREVVVDRARDTALVYVEMLPGAVFPDHRHAATERGLVLTGDLQTGERLLRTGDFYEAAAGTQHERIASPSGCTGLLWLGAEAWERWRFAAEAMARGRK